MQLTLTSAARQDVADAALWYANQRRGLEEDFIEAIDDELAKVATNPEVFSFVYGKLRLAPVRRFPYNVIYEIASDEIKVFAVMHASRNPGIWLRRAQKR